MRRSWAWKMTFGLAAIAIVAFVTFEILDLDGSQMRAQVAMCTEAEGESSVSERLSGIQPASDFVVPILPLRSPSDASAASWLARRALYGPTPRSAALAQGRWRSSFASAHASPSASDPV